MPTADAQLRKRLLDRMILIRAFEEKLIELTEAQRLPGMQILAVGQEAVAAGVVLALDPRDVIVTNHRSHGHILARYDEPGPLLAEIMGKATGVNLGKAGTLHLAVPEANILMTSTVVGAGPPLAVGAAFAQQYRGEEAITVVFFGDGAAAEGSVHEAMNLAGVWKLPILFVCENNCWAGAQRYGVHCPVGEIASRGAAYGMPGELVDGNDADKVLEAAARLAGHCRSGRGPALLEALTYRMRGHGELDRQHYVPKEELAEWAARDPIVTYRSRLADEGVVTSQEAEAMRQRARERVEEAAAFAEASPYPPAGDALLHLWADERGREGASCQ